MDWKLAEAETRLKEVVDLAQHSGPQQLTQGGDVVAVILSRSEYERLTHEPIQVNGAKPKMTFLEALMSGPSLDGIDLSRNKSPSRPVDLGDE